MVKQKKGKTQQKRRKILVKQKKGENTVKRARWGRCFTRIFHLRKRERENSNKKLMRLVLKKLAEIVIIGFLFFEFLYVLFFWRSNNNLEGMLNDHQHR